MKTETLEDFYKGKEAFMPEGISKEIGHFNVFDMAALFAVNKERMPMLYNRRSYYKISLIRGKSVAEYADRSIDIEKNGILFATPKIPYNWVPIDPDQRGYFCIFTEEFLNKSKTGIVLDNLAIFKAGGYPVFQLPKEQADNIAELYKKMIQEMSSDYSYKYDLLRNYVIELIHLGQKLQPATTLYPNHTASARVSALFIELLERQFPIESPQQRLRLRTAKDYAERLSIHVNHLNKVLKENTGQTTTNIIGSRVIKEAKLLLKQTNWNISEIAYSLGFEEVAHFSNFFKKQTSHTPVSFRN